MKRQNGVILIGMLRDVRAGQVTADTPLVDPGQVASMCSELALNEAKGQAMAGSYVTAMLVTDHEAYGGHHQVIFPEEHAADVLAYWALTSGNLEVAVEGWLRSTPGTAGRPATAAVVVDRVIYLSVTAAMRDQVARYKAEARQRPGQAVGCKQARTR